MSELIDSNDAESKLKRIRGILDRRDKWIKIHRFPRFDIDTFYINEIRKIMNERARTDV